MAIRWACSTARSRVATRISKAAMALTVASWWSFAGDIYKVEAATKREKEFVALVDAKFQEAMRTLQPPS
jgi:hypothetical protein